ncbi:ammonium transporter, partial [Candidatus Woesearchaeota archaeon CG_4_10_14_0_2_um_filter_57_5]
AMVFFMQGGFAMLETGLTRAKNASNIMMKNLMDFAAGSIGFWMVGYGLMFGAGNLIYGKEGFFLNSPDPWTMTFFMFQLVFAATAATIVSGAVSERIQFKGYLLYSVFITAFLYPVIGHWIWGQGWLAAKGFIDFAGSTVVHSVGGWAALAGALVLGPRIGRFPKHGARPIRGHSLTLAALGVFILWFGWYGFNPGSTVSGTDPRIAMIAVTTTLAAAAGAVSSMTFAWLRYKTPDVSLTLGGTIGGLVGITAGTANVSPLDSIIIGAIAGILYVLGVALLDKLRIDDPVGAVPAHAFCGAWGTLAVGLFSSTADAPGLFYGGGTGLLATQLLGVASVFVAAFGTMYLFFRVIDKTVGLRVSKEDELKGLDLVEHSTEAYADFNITASND